MDVPLAGHRLPDTANPTAHTHTRMPPASSCPQHFRQSQSVFSLELCKFFFGAQFVAPAGGARLAQKASMIDCFGVELCYMRHGQPDTLYEGRSGGPSFSKTKTHVNAKNSRKMFTTLVAATPPHTHIHAYIQPALMEAFLGFPSLILLLQRAFFNYLLCQTQSNLPVLLN